MHPKTLKSVFVSFPLTKRHFLRPNIVFSYKPTFSGLTEVFNHAWNEPGFHGYDVFKWTHFLLKDTARQHILRVCQISQVRLRQEWILRINYSSCADQFALSVMRNINRRDGNTLISYWVYFFFFKSKPCKPFCFMAITNKVTETINPLL